MRARRPFFIKTMSTLSIYVDEAGVLDINNNNSKYYILSFVFHDESFGITNNETLLNNKLDSLGFKLSSFHSGPLIRREEDFVNVDRETRKKIFMAMMAFFRTTRILCKTIVVEKKHLENVKQLINSLRIELNRFLNANLDFFINFSQINIYYDNGQPPVGRLIYDVFQECSNNVSYNVIDGRQHTLFQVCDMLCTLKLIETKAEKKESSKSELAFFNYSSRLLKKHYLSVIEKKTLGEEK